MADARDQHPPDAGPATGQTIALPGADFIDHDPAAGRIAKVVGYFDSATLLTQLGLQAHITPADAEPVTRWGVGLRVDTQRSAFPGAFTVTHIDPEHQFTLFDATTSVVTEQLGNGGYLGSCFASIGPRNYTFTAGDQRRGCQGRAARRCLPRGDAHGEDRWAGRQRGRYHQHLEAEVLSGTFHAGPGSSGELSELTGQWP
jgi:hypothetical protein